MTNPTIEAAVQSYLSKMTPDQLAKSNAYFEGGYWIQLWGFLIAMLFLWLLLRTGLAAGIRNKIVGRTRYVFLQDFLFAMAYLIANAIFTFPFGVYTDFFREHQYGLSNMSFGSWLGDFLKASAVGLILFPFFIAVIYKLIRKFKKTWWIWGTLTTTIFLVFVGMFAPVFIAPIFNSYKPLAPGPVRDSVLTMAHSNGIPADEVWEFDASRQSNRVSANVSGLFGTTRISLNDNLLKRCNEHEIRAVMGHEMGHYVMNHGLKNIIMFALVFVVGFALMQWSLGATIARFGSAWGIVSVGDIAGLPVLLALFTIFVTVTTPVFNSIVRMQEIEADMFGLNLSREPDGEAEVALKLGDYRKMSPGPLEEILFFDHPSGEHRIRMAMTWKFYQQPAQ